MDIQGFDSKLEKFKNELKQPCIAIIGETGAGKSSLIRAVFGIETKQKTQEELEIPSGSGRPITDDYKQYPYPPDETKPIRLYDTPGYEVKGAEDFLNNTKKFLEERQFKITETPTSNDKIIHLIWYVVNQRYQDFDIRLIKEIIELKFPLLIVINKVDAIAQKDLEKVKREFKDDLKKELRLDISDTQMLEVAADPNINSRLSESAREDELSEYKAKLLKLVDQSIELLPETYQNAFIYSQEIDIRKKKTVAWTFISFGVAAVVGASFTPIPGSTSFATLSTQNRLMQELEYLYGLEKYSSQIGKEVKLLEERTTVLMWGVVIDIASLTVGAIFPAAFFAVETIAGSLAATYIVILSLAYTKTLEATSLRILNKKRDNDEIINFMKTEFKKNFEKYSSKIPDISKSVDLEKIGNDFLDES